MSSRVEKWNIEGTSFCHRTPGLTESPATAVEFRLTPTTTPFTTPKAPLTRAQRGSVLDVRGKLPLAVASNLAL